MLWRCGEGETCPVCSGVKLATDQFGLHLVPSSPCTEQLCKRRGRESDRDLGWGLRDVHMLEGTEGSGPRWSGCGSDAGNQTSLRYPHGKHLGLRDARGDTAGANTGEHEENGG